MASQAAPAPRANPEPRNREDCASLVEQAGGYREAENIRNCGQKHWVGTCDCEGVYHQKVYRCNSRYCLSCHPIAVKRLERKHLPMLKELLGKKRKGWGFKHIVLTIPAGAYNGETVKMMFEGLKAVTRTTKLVDKAGKTVERRLFPRGSGFFSVFEVGHGGKYYRGGRPLEGSQRNPHLHVLVYTSKYVNYDWLRFAWRRAFPKSRMVRVESVSTARGGARGVFRYIMKYFQKPFELNPERFKELYRALRRRRRVHTMGAFYNWKPEHPEHAEPEIDTCPWCKACGQAVRWDHARLYANDDPESPWYRNTLQYLSLGPRDGP